MKTVILGVLAGLIPTIKAVAAGFEADVTHPEKVVIGEAIMLAADALQFAIDKLHGKDATPPTMPDSLANA